MSTPPKPHVKRALDEWEENSKDFPEHLEIARTWDDWNDMTRQVQEHAIDTLQKEADELRASAIRNKGRSYPNMSAANRFWSIVYDLAIKKLRENSKESKEDNTNEQ